MMTEEQQAEIKAAIKRLKKAVRKATINDMTGVYAGRWITTDIERLTHQQRNCKLHTKVKTASADLRRLFGIVEEEEAGG